MQSSDFEWFMLNMPAVYAKYGDCFLAIKDKTPFCVTITGFDPNRDITAAKLRYDYKKEEVEDGVSV